MTHVSKKTDEKNQVATRLEFGEKEDDMEIGHSGNIQESNRVINGLGMVSRGVPALVGCAIKGFPWEKSTEQRRRLLLDKYRGDLNQTLHAVLKEVRIAFHYCKTRSFDVSV